MILKPKILMPLLLVSSLTGCQQGLNSDVMGLAAEQKPEGFLIVSDFAEDKAKPGTFLVNCIRQDGKAFQETKTKAEIAKNNICKTVAAAAPVNKPPAAEQPPEDGNAEQPKVNGGPESLPFDKSAVTLRLKTNTVAESYIKREAAIDVTKSKATLVEGVDFCVVPAVFGADSVCRFSSVVLRVSGHTLKSCAAMTDKAYIYEPHFSLTPSTVSACK